MVWRRLPVPSPPLPCISARIAAPQNRVLVPRIPKLPKWVRKVVRCSGVNFQNNVDTRSLQVSGAQGEAAVVNIKTNVQRNVHPHNLSRRSNVRGAISYHVPGTV